MKRGLRWTSSWTRRRVADAVEAVDLPALITRMSTAPASNSSPLTVHARGLPHEPGPVVGMDDVGPGPRPGEEEALRRNTDTFSPH